MVIGERDGEHHIVYLSLDLTSNMNHASGIIHQRSPSAVKKTTVLESQY